MNPLTTATSAEEGQRDAQIAVLPVGSFEQHGRFLPLATDTLIACLIAREITTAYDLFLLPPITFGASHEHAGFPGTVSIRAADSLDRSGITRLAVVNAHGGNYVLANVVQEANEHAARMILFPSRTDWRPPAPPPA